MIDKKLTPAERLAILLAGGRQNPEPSHAVEQRYYGNPADSIEFEAEKARRAKKKAKRSDK